MTALARAPYDRRSIVENVLFVAESNSHMDS
jgi:hypothetical protein